MNVANTPAAEEAKDRNRLKNRKKIHRERQNMHTWILYVWLRTTLLVKKSHFFSAAYSLSLTGCQRSLVIDYSVLIRLSLPKEKQPCKHHGYFQASAVAKSSVSGLTNMHHKPRQYFKVGLYFLN